MSEDLRLNSYGLKFGAIFLTFFFLTTINAISQGTFDSQKKTLNQKDTLLLTGEVVKGKKTVKYFSPYKASMFSAVLPGMGQIYNRKYWKAPIVWGGLAIAGYLIYYNQKEYTFFKNGYRDYVLQDPGNKSYQQILNDPKRGVAFTKNGLKVSDFEPGGKHSAWFSNYLNNAKVNYKRNLDYSYLAVGIIYVLNIIDASVDAHFKQFDITDDLSINWEPICTPRPSLNTTYGLAINLTFK